MRYLPEIITTQGVQLLPPTAGNQFNSVQLNGHSFAPFETPFIPFCAPLCPNTTVAMNIGNLDKLAE